MSVPASGRTEQAWLDLVRAAILRGEITAAQAALVCALAEYPASADLRRAHAGILVQTGGARAAERILRDLLECSPGDAGSAFTLAGTLKEQGRTAAAASVIRACLATPPNPGKPDLAIAAIELLDDCDRKAAAAAIAAAAIEASPDDPRLHAYAGMLEIQLGEFDRARQHYLFALEHDPRAWEWHVPIGLSTAQRYVDPEHPDFARFRAGLQRVGLSEKARAELEFALGKAHDDMGDYAEAAVHFRRGNAIAHRLTRWSRKAWRRAVEARLAAKPAQQHLEPSDGFTPVFIVGMPRSGTTLMAELLSRYPSVCNRGELPWIARLAERPALSGEPERAALRDAAATYTAQSRRDDAGDARWFIDKQPLNFRYVDLIVAMFPHTRIIHCRRNRRDTALSLWMQCFMEEVQGYAYDFGDVSLVMRDCDKLMAHWRERHPDTIRAVHYEDLAAAPQTVVGALAQWIGLPPQAPAAPATGSSTISTASLWQARQPVTTRSVGRWRHYAQHVPELLRFSE